MLTVFHFISRYIVYANDIIKFSNVSVNLLINRIVSHRFVMHCNKLYCLYYVVLYCIAMFYIACIVLYCNYYIVLYYSVSYRIVIYSIKLYCIVCTVLYDRIVLYCTVCTVYFVCYHITSHRIVLHYIISYCTTSYRIQNLMLLGFYYFNAEDSEKQNVDQPNGHREGNEQEVEQQKPGESEMKFAADKLYCQSINQSISQ